MDPRFPDRDSVVTADLLARFGAADPDRPFAVFADETWSYGRAGQEAWAMAAGLIELGVAQDDFVASWLPNGQHALRTWLGANAAGATYAPLNPAYRGSLLQHAIEYSGAEVMVAPAMLIERLRGIELGRLRTIVVVGADREPLPAGPPGVRMIRWRDVVRPGSGRPELPRRVECWDTMALIYTSGTTGPSKAVLCSYLHHLTYCEQLMPYATADDRFFACLPMFHAGGTTSVYGMLRLGASVAITDGFRTQTFLQEARRYGTTMGVILGSMATFLEKRPPGPEDRDHPLRKAIVAPMVRDPAAFHARFGIDLLAAYGMTEATCPLRSELNPADPDTCGRLVSDDYELRLVDEHDREVPVGAVGELAIRHDRPWSLCSGYRGMPEATAAAWRNGWFHTGDAMRRDEAGNYYFVDRAKDALRRRGENVSSLEVEQEILAHEDVVEAAVVAAPSEHMEDEILAVVALRPGSALGPEELTRWLIPRLPYFMVPRYLDFVDELPRTESQKVRKHVLRERGVTATTWDREAAGIRIRRERIAT